MTFAGSALLNTPQKNDTKSPAVVASNAFSFRIQIQNLAFTRMESPEAGPFQN